MSERISEIEYLYKIRDKLDERLRKIKQRMTINSVYNKKYSIDSDMRKELSPQDKSDLRELLSVRKEISDKMAEISVRAFTSTPKVNGYGYITPAKVIKALEPGRFRLTDEVAPAKPSKKSVKKPNTLGWTNASYTDISSDHVSITF